MADVVAVGHVEVAVGEGLCGGMGVRVRDAVGGAVGAHGVRRDAVGEDFGVWVDEGLPEVGGGDRIKVGGVAAPAG